MKKKNKRAIEIEVLNFGLYESWDRDSHQLPAFREIANEIKAEIGIEFGMIVEIRKARGSYLDFVIEHPSIKDGQGEVLPPFTGTFRVKHNPFLFFLGDTIWEPIDDKRGAWNLAISQNEKVLISKTLQLV